MVETVSSGVKACSLMLSSAEIRQMMGSSEALVSCLMESGPELATWECDAASSLVCVPSKKNRKCDFPQANS